MFSVMIICGDSFSNVWTVIVSFAVLADLVVVGLELVIDHSFDSRMTRNERVLATKASKALDIFLLMAKESNTKQTLLLHSPGMKTVQCLSYVTTWTVDIGCRSASGHPKASVNGTIQIPHLTRCVSLYFD